MRPLALTLAVLLAFVTGALAAPTLVQGYPHPCVAGLARWTLCGGFTITQSTASLGGPQALEGFTTVAHPTGTVALALGTIGNIDISGAGEVTDARALQGGIVISGPGVVEHATSLYLAAPQRRGDYTGPVHIQRADFVTFSNGWSLRPAGARLLLCDPTDQCRDF